jgi:hypothetical protein
MKEAHSELAEPPSGTSIDGPHLAPSITSEGQYGFTVRQGAQCVLPRIGWVPRLHSARAALGSSVCCNAFRRYVALKRALTTLRSARTPVLP